MRPPEDIETLLTVVEAMPRPELVGMLREVPCPFPVDFTDDYLSQLSLDRLKHLVVAVCLHVRKSPTTVSAA